MRMLIDKWGLECGHMRSFNLKIPINSEFISNMQTEFSPSGIHSRH